MPHRIHQHLEYYRPSNAPSVDEIWARLEKEVMIFTQAECIALKNAYNQRKEQAKQAAVKSAKRAQQLAEDIRAGRIVEEWPVSLPSPDGRRYQYNVVCKSNDTVLALKIIISEHTQQPVENICLLYAGRQLEDERSLQDYNIDRDHVSGIHILYRSKSHTDHAPVDSLTAETLDTATLEMRSVPANIPNSKTVRDKNDSGIVGINGTSSAPAEEKRHAKPDGEQGAIPQIKVVETTLPTVDLFIKTLTGKTSTMTCDPSETILAIKERILNKEGIAIDQQLIMHGDKNLEDNRPLSFYFPLKWELRLVMRLKKENSVVESLLPEFKPSPSSNCRFQLLCGISATFGAVALIIAFGVLHVATAGTAAGITLAVLGGIAFFGGGIGLTAARCKKQSDDILPDSAIFNA